MRQMFKKIAIAMCLTFAVGTMINTVTATEAMAKGKKEEAKAPKAKANLDDSLGTLAWGMDHEKVTKLLADKLNDDMRVKIKGSTDESYADMMRKSYSERIDNMRKSYMILRKDNVASLSVSIVGEEFMPDNQEALLIQREDIATKYFFFLNDKLYKMAVVYDANYLGPIAFDTFCATAEDKYGKAVDEVWDDDANFLESIWKNKTTTLTVKNKYSSYNTFLMVFSEEATDKPLVAQHKSYYNSINNGPEISSAIDLLTADDGEGEGSSVDAILGKDTKVDLLAGLSKEDRDIAEGKISAKEVEKEKKAKAKKAAASRKKNDAKVKKGLEIF